MAFVNLPSDTKREIISFSDFTALSQFSNTSKELRAIADVEMARRNRQAQVQAFRDDTQVRLAILARRQLRRQQLLQNPPPPFEMFSF